MQRSSWFSCFLTGIVALLFLAGCQDTPPSIQFDTSEGQVINYEDTTIVPISGKVVAGTNSVTGLQVVTDTALNSKIADIEIGEGGSFTYDFPLTDPAINKFSTCRFKIIDSMLLSAQERITFIGGTAANQGAPAQYDTLEQAASVLINEEFVNTLSEAIQNVVNTRLQDIIDDSGLLPLEMDLVEDGLLQIAATLDEVDISDVSIGHIGFEDGQEIRTTNIEGVSKAFHIGNLHIAGNFQLAIHIPLDPFPPIHVEFPSTAFDINVNDVELDEMQMWAFYKPATNDVVVRFDVDDLTPEFWSQLNIDVIIGNLDLASIPFIGPFLDAIWDAIINFFIELFGNIFVLLFDTLAIPIVDVDNLAMTIDTAGLELAGIPLDMSLDVATWFPLATGPGTELPVYLTNAGPGCGSDCGELYMEFGLAASATPLDDPPNYLEHYYSTPGDMLPNHVGTRALAFDTDIGVYQNLTVALNDDTVNMGAWALLQTGLLEGMDISPVFSAAVSGVFPGMGGAKVDITLRTPPIADFSGPTEMTDYPTSEGATYCEAGKFTIKDMVINMDNVLLDLLIDTVRVSVDVDVAIELVIDEEGKRVEVYMGSGSLINIAYLYVNNKNMVLLTAITNDIVKWVMNNVVLPGLIKIEVPAVELYDIDIQPYVYATQVGGENNMIVRLGVSEFPAP